MDMHVSNGIRYIGVDDLDIDLFEGQYVVPEGMSYNSYLIKDEKIAVMDTVDVRKSDEWMQNLTNELGGKSPDYLVSLHLEPDHAANIVNLLKRFPNCQCVCSAKEATMLSQFFDFDFTGRVMPMKEGDTLKLGKHTLTFVMAPMVHWPEVMVAYESTEKVLFAADGFGKFGAIANETDDWACEARRYYFNICGKHGAQVQSLLKKAATLDIQIICPLHGPVLKENLGYYINLYDTWSSYAVETDGVFIAYASIHGNTAKVALRLAEILKEKGIKVATNDLTRDDMAEGIEDAFRYNRMVLAAASYDAGVMPAMESFLCHLKSKNYQKRKVALIENGSWAPSAGRVMRAALESMKEINIVEPMVTIKSTMKVDDEAKLQQLATSILGE